MSPGHSHVAVTLALGDLLLGRGVEESFSPPSTSPLDRAFPTCVFSAALAGAGWMLVHHSLPWRHSQISPDPGPFCLLKQMGLSLEQGWEVSTHHRRQIPLNRLLLRSEPQGCAYGCRHLLPGGGGAHRGLGKGLSSLLVALEGSRHLQGVQSRGRTGMCGHPGGALPASRDQYTTLARAAQPWQSPASSPGVAAAGPAAGGILGEQPSVLLRCLLSPLSFFFLICF